ncbi:hypothetical protein MMC10_004889 [Thelotrema lepadinum]|nr:hypothetical protein [Thelotrema lepadinum]
MHCSNIFTAGALLLSTAFVAASPARHFKTGAALTVRTSKTPPFHTSEFVTLGCPNTTVAVASSAEQFDAANNFAQMLFIQKKIPQAFSTYVATDLINHAPSVSGDGAALAQSTVGPLLSVAKIEIQFVTVGNDHATTFFKATTPGGVTAAMEVFRLSGTCLVEHWVVNQEVTNSSNPHAYF